MERSDELHASDRSPDWLEQIDHTADVGFVVVAADLKQLFARAAWGMFSVVTDVESVRPEKTRRVMVEATDRHELMVKWLSELNFLHVTQHKVFSRFEISELSDTRIVAEISGEKTDPARHTIYTEIKAVTFHDLKIEQTDEAWKAQIIFDL
jgi:SHS2 domain-containing protein